MLDNQKMSLSLEAKILLSILKRLYATPEDGWFSEEGFWRKTHLQVDHSIFEELKQAGHIEYADVYVWKRTNYDQ